MVESGKAQLIGNLPINTTSDVLSMEYGSIEAPFGNVINSFRGTRHRRWVSDEEEMSASPHSHLLKLLRSTDDSNRPRFSLHRRNRRRRGHAVDLNTVPSKNSNFRPGAADFGPIHRRNSNSHLSANVSVQDKDEDLIENWLKVLVEGDISSDTKGDISSDTKGKESSSSMGHENLSSQKSAPVKTKQWTKTPQPHRKTTTPRIRDVSPAYPCEQWDVKSRTCWSVRAVGDAITFSLTFDGNMNVPPSYQVVWTKHYHIRHRNHSVVEKINPDEPPWNMAIGKKGLELRVSPITDDDLDRNKFVASVWKIFRHPYHRRFFKKVNFRIEITPIDLGYVYIGEHITISIERYATLPPDSMIFDWHLEGERGMLDLYSNMAVSRTRRVLHIKELRKQQEGFISCFVYTDIGVFVSKRRFYVHELNNEMLTGNKNGDNAVINTIEVRIPRDNTKGDSFYEDLYEPESSYRDTPTNIKKLSKMSGHMEVPKNEADRQYSSDGGHFGDRWVSPHQNKVRNKYVYHNSNSPSYKYHSDAAGRRARVHSPVNSADSSLRKTIHAMENYTSLQKSNLLDDHPPLKSGFISEKKNHGRMLPPITEEPEKTTMESDLLVFHLNSDDESVEVDIKESLLVSRCSSDRQCSTHANCVQLKSNQPGHCECVHGYRGNGIFCWEHMDFMPPLEAPLIPKQDYTSSDESSIRSSSVDESHDDGSRNSLHESFQELLGDGSPSKARRRPNVWNNLPQQKSSLSKQQHSNQPQDFRWNDSIQPKNSAKVNNERFISEQMNRHRQHTELPHASNNYRYNGKELQTSHLETIGGTQEDKSSEEIVDQR